MNVKTKFDLGSRLKCSFARKEIWIKEVNIRIRSSQGFAPGQGKNDIEIIYTVDFYDLDNPKHRDVFGMEERVYETKKYREDILAHEFPLLDISKD